MSELQHFGVKGMKWGVRRSETTVNLVDDKTGAKRPIKINPKKTKMSRNADGSLELVTNSKREQNRIHKQTFKKSTSDDFKNADTARSIARVAGTKALSNKELQDLVTRMNLEKQYSTLNPTKAKVAKKFIADTMLQVGKQQLTKLAQDQAAKQIAKMLSGK